MKGLSGLARVVALCLAAGGAAGSLAAEDDEGAFDARVDTLWLETGGLVDHPEASGSGLLHGAVSGRGHAGAWEYMLGARFDANTQFGGQDYTRLRVDYAENYLRWRGDDTRVTVGAQNIMWGRVDEISPIDRMSRADLTRIVLDKLPERRRAVPAVRVEHYVDEIKIDAVWLPAFDDAVMPDRRSVWHPVDTEGGRLLGLGEIPLLKGFRVKEADQNGSGGGGIRVTKGGDELDYGFSIQRVRQSQPYYRVTPGVLQAVHPYSTVLGGELEAERLGATWRMEAAWSSDVPVTTRDFRFLTRRGFDVVLGTEFFPGDGETRVTLQVSGHKTSVDQRVLDRTEFYAFNGEIEHPFARGRWRADLRFVVGIGERDLYLNPKLTYTGIDEHEIFIAAHVFDGAEKTLGGYYDRNDSVMLGWLAKF
ncbi:hypothetical protein [Thauera linaloolentis]|uniref:Uncharacterized protein n=1 Tax=Thauera linaloolentis (strain DSM 12138 / JCM 21573 / CCUG 41526 / CIP 105981 / IAM 15112 / NBRC 102519 / 47Lol) TaxID=1123367 RepID=N6ZC99_THAL4|nr:hypothetical protein [Thauera linaloolentis]ENO89799.1 hypothetical protein C666_04480 [Thauera linaloolentis 47Lol = DSM 12138]MCM8567012.1 hypothetical protein [Thauera linaloolentis]